MSTINIPVVVEFSAEDRERLDRFNALVAEYLKHFAPVNLEGGVASLGQHAEPTETAPVPSADAELLKAELKALVQKLVASGQRDATRAIVQQYATRVSDVPEDKRAECIDQLKALEVKA